MWPKRNPSANSVLLHVIRGALPSTTPRFWSQWSVLKTPCVSSLQLSKTTSLKFCRPTHLFPVSKLEGNSSRVLGMGVEGLCGSDLLFIHCFEVSLFCACATTLSVSQLLPFSQHVYLAHSRFKMPLLKVIMFVFACLGAKLTVQLSKTLRLLK